jgi:hypothetical protein
MDQRFVGMSARRRLGAPSSHLDMANQGLEPKGSSALERRAAEMNALRASQPSSDLPPEQQSTVDHLHNEHGYGSVGDYYHEMATGRPMTQSPDKFHDFEHANYPQGHTH